MENTSQSVRIAKRCPVCDAPVSIVAQPFGVRLCRKCGIALRVVWRNRVGIFLASLFFSALLIIPFVLLFVLDPHFPAWYSHTWIVVLAIAGLAAGILALDHAELEIQSPEREERSGRETP